MMAAPSPFFSSISASFEIDRAISKNINALLEGLKWGAGGVGSSATVYYSFPTSNSSALWSTEYSADSNSELYSGFRALNNFQQTQATAALQSWASVANIDIQPVSTETTTAVGDIRVAFTSGSDMDASTYAYAYLPGGAAFAGDVWLNANQPIASGDDYTAGANGYQTFIHELGHALGLAHPFEGSVKLEAKFENLKYTVMSYSDAPKHEDSGSSSFYPTTPMLFDIQAIQYLYGANMSYNASDNVYVFEEGATYYETIWDAGGIDTVQYNATTGGTINLNAGNFSRMGQSILLDKGTITNETIAIAYNVTIENAIGGSGNDVITGNSANNYLDGSAGVDQLAGGKGDDTYTVDFSLGSNKIILEDKVTEAKSAGNDTIILRGSVTPSSALATLKLISNIENIDLSQTNGFNINVTGDKNANLFIGNAGNNVLDGGTGADILVGGAGDDAYVIDQAGDVISEANNAGDDTVIIKFKSTSTLTLADDFEHATVANSQNFNVIGNAANNVLTGNSKTNVLNGGAGIDTLFGGAGKDTLIGGSENDVLSGGAGADTFVWFLADKGIEGTPVIDIIRDFSLKQKDALNLRDLLDGENSAEIANFLDITLNGTQTDIRISTSGGFVNGLYDSAQEDTRIVLENVNLLGASQESEVLAMLINKNFLMIDS